MAHRACLAADEPAKVTPLPVAIKSGTSFAPSPTTKQSLSEACCSAALAELL